MARKPAPLIAKATDRIAANAFAKAVELLVEAWRGHRSPRPALLAERAGRLANQTVLPDPVVAINRPVGGLAQALAALAEDPRVVPALVADVKRRYPDPGALAFGDALVEAILAQHDPATPALLATLDRKGNPVNVVGAKHADRLHVPVPAPSAEIERACDACDRALLDAELRVEQGREGGEILLRAIYDDPADHDLRAVWGDWLAERGDPRGELIALQMLRDHREPQRARMQELERTHARAWLGPVAEACVAVWFEAGFPAGGVVDASRWLACRDAVEWGTFESLSFATPQPIPLELVAAPALRNLRFLGGIAAEQIHAFRSERQRLPITGLGIANQHGMPPHVLSEIFQLVAFLELDELGLDKLPHDGFATLFADPAARRITRLRIPRQPEMLDTIMTLPAHVTTVELAAASRTGWAFTWSRAIDDPRWSRLAIEHRPTQTDDGAPIGELTALVGALPADQLVACSLRLIGSRAGSAELGALALALARQTRMTELVLPRR